MNLSFPCTITDVFERKVQKHLSGTGTDALFSATSIGWYLQIDGAFSIYVGMERPDFRVDDPVILSIRKPA